MEAHNREYDSMWSALLRVVDAGQELLADRLDLSRLELKESIARGTSKLALTVVGGIFVAVGWIIFMAAVVLLLSPRMPIPVSLAGLGALNGLLGAVLVGLGLRRRESLIHRQLAADELRERQGSRSDKWASTDARAQRVAAP